MFGALPMKSNCNQILGEKRVREENRSPHVIK